MKIVTFPFRALLSLSFCAEPLNEENLKLFRENIKRYHSVIPNCGKSQCLHANPGSKDRGWELIREKDEYKLSKTAQNEQKLRKHAETEAHRKATKAKKDKEKKARQAKKDKEKKALKAKKDKERKARKGKVTIFKFTS